jgi:hypothetical protein
MLRRARLPLSLREIRCPSQLRCSPPPRAIHFQLVQQLVTNRMAAERVEVSATYRTIVGW